MKRQHAVMELLETEKSYVEALHMLVEVENSEVFVCNRGIFEATSMRAVFSKAVVG